MLFQLRGKSRCSRFPPKLLLCSYLGIYPDFPKLKIEKGLLWCPSGYLYKNIHRNSILKEKMFLFKCGPFFSFFVISIQFINTVDSKNYCQWLDLNLRSLMLGVTALPTAPQSQPKTCTTYNWDSNSHPTNGGEATDHAPLNWKV